MATKMFKWRTAHTGTEGVSTVYVHERGSDLTGEGTRNKPYQSLGKAYRASDVKPTTIICVGRFSEMLADGNHTCTINGDYYGAAVFDGAGYYVMYGFRHNRIIIKNTGVGSYDLSVWTGSELLAGVGSSNLASTVGSANHVNGVAGSSVFLDEASLYMGVLGGSSAIKYNCYSRVIANDDHKISLGCYSTGQVLSHLTIFGVAIEDRRKKVTTNYATYSSCLFSEFDFFADDKQIFDTCFFAKDCKWYFDDNEIMIVGNDSESRLQSLIDAMDILEINENLRPEFVNCHFSNETSSDVFNNVSKQDYTLKINSDAVINDATYYGAFPPSLNIPIMTDSSEVAATWDENSCAGHIVILNDEIVIDTSSLDNTGEILSKIIHLDVSKINIGGLISQFDSRLHDYGLYLNEKDVTDDEYLHGEVLPIGAYLAKGNIVYEGLNYSDGSIVFVENENTHFFEDDASATLVYLLDVNYNNVCYVRMCPIIYKKIIAEDGLERGGVYINAGDSNITYRGRTIVPGESFVADNDTDSFEGPEDYEIGVIFDDTRVPSFEWIPAQLFGEYFVWRKNGAIQLDSEGVPIASGNYLSFQTSANGGYSNLLKKTVINHAYVQFAFKTRMQ